MDERNPTHQRWYDKHKTVAKSVKLIETFPEEIQAIIADGIVRLAERECQAKEMMAELRSLGPEKVLGIFKSKNKRRSYDTNNTVHQAMNYLYILSEENRLFIAGEVIEIVNFIYDYLKDCKKFKAPPSAEDVAGLTNAYIEVGPEEAKKLLGELHERFNASLSQHIMGNEEFLSEDTKGMKIREERFFPQDKKQK